MKKFAIGLIVCTALLMGLCSIPASAASSGRHDADSLSSVNYNPYKHGVRVGISGTPFVLGLMTDVADGINFGHHYIYRYPSVKDFYSDFYGPLYTTGNVGAEFDWVLKKWMTVSAGAYFTGFWADRFDGMTGARMRKENGLAVSLVATFRFTYLNRRYVQLYSGVSAGAFVIGASTGEVSGMVHIQGIPIGVSVGRKVFGFAEVGIGTMYMGGNIGLGYRF